MAEEAARWMDREALAAYVSVRVDYIPRLVRSGKLPEPSYHLGPKCPRWDRAALDACFEGAVRSGPRGIDELVQEAIERI